MNRLSLEEDKEHRRAVQNNADVVRIVNTFTIPLTST